MLTDNKTTYAESCGIDESMAAVLIHSCVQVPFECLLDASIRFVFRSFVVEACCCEGLLSGMHFWRICIVMH